jgi:hypothetical protein
MEVRINFTGNIIPLKEFFAANLQEIYLKLLFPYYDEAKYEPI